MNVRFHPDHAPVRSVSGVELAQGVGVQEAKGFWADAWSRVVKRPGAMFGLGWLGVVCFFAIFAPFIASGHPLVMHELDASGAVIKTTSPFLRFLRPTDVLLVVGLFGSLAWLFLPRARGEGAKWCMPAGGLIVLLSAGTLALVSPIAGSALGSPPEPEAIEVAKIAAMKWTLVAAGLAAVGWMILALSTPRSERGASLFVAVLQAGLIVWGAAQFQSSISQPRQDLSAWMAALKDRPLLAAEASTVISLIVWLVAAIVPMMESRLRQAACFGAVGIVTAAALIVTWEHPLQTYNYREREAAGEVRCTYTLIPFSPTQSSTRLYVEPPGGTVYEPVFSDIQMALVRSATPPGAIELPRLTEIPVSVADLALVDKVLKDQGVPSADAETIRATAEAVLGSGGASAAQLLSALRDLPFHRFILGSDPLGQDVLSQLMHACRLSISIGLVSTGIAVLIGVTLGALMGYFGGLVDLFLYRVVEVFMAIPVLFLLIVAAAVLPRNTYVMMAIIGCVTWTGAARFIRAEFFKLRNQDFVQSARAVGLPLRSILFKHMLPNGVTPVLVDSSFAVAAAILAESTLSFLGLGPDGQASWGKLLSSATGITGTFVWWLAIFPGFAIFLTVLSYNLIGEAMRDAIDPKLKKARV